MRQNLVKEWMSSNPIIVDVNTKLPEAHRLMKNKGVRRLPVLDKSGTGARIVGIVTLGDIRGAEPSKATSLSIWELNYLIAKIEIGEIMTKDVVTIQADDSVEEAARLMLEQKISGLPVVDGEGNLVGMITESDIFRIVVHHGWESPIPV